MMILDKSFTNILLIFQGGTKNETQKRKTDAC